MEEESTPLLSNYSSDDVEPSKADILDDFIEEYIGGFRWSQALQVILISMASFFEAQQTFITIFADANPSWHYTQGTSNSTACNSGSNICKLPADSWQWDRPARTSIISDWSLLCTSNKILAGLPASSFFMGCLLGGIILSFLGDSLGRKKLLILSCLTMSTASIFTAFSNNIWIYSGFRAVSGLGRAAIGSCVLVLTTESVGKQWRGKVGVVGFLCSTLGYMSLPAIAYMARDYSWRSLYLLTSAPAIVYCMLIEFCVYESPKWLLEQGRVREAVAVLNANLDPNRKNLSFSADNIRQNTLNRPESTGGAPNPSLLKIMSDRSIIQQLTMAMLIGFGIGLIYYGTPLGLGSFDFSLYLSVAFSAMLEIPSAVLTFYLARCRRRTSLLALSTISGGCGIICILVKRWVWLQIGLQLMSFFSACAAFNLLMIYTVELFPTTIRNSAVSIVWQAIVFGGAISPLVIAIGEGYSKILPHFLFGVMIFIFGPLVLFLKETVVCSRCVEDRV
ncbi:OLC1v1029738C1 [Oldenlandia corymbosa var. corymbosa]|uniref:OLC1v1029738C1 n=1 Tax=Oldenlandia corymbosa var. corymbosa TaxID=529605 RepID=A0AAV1CHP2_OLDCO|nr:OLC1v1029738C1 [Oldenlandia corymbosa var. corymbosa]